MNAKKAEILLRLARPGSEKSGDRATLKAVRWAEKDERSRRLFEEQRLLDRRILDILTTVTLPETLSARVADAKAMKRHEWRRAIPSLLAVLLALAVLGGLLVFYGMQRAKNFVGKDAALEMIQTTDEMNGLELEPVSMNAGGVGDWLFLNHNLEHYDVPPAFAGLKAVGCRVFKQHGLPVAQIAIDEKKMLFFVFRASDFHVQLNPPGRWTTFEHEDWAVAIRRDGDSCFMAAFRGREDEMKKWINRAEKKRFSVANPGRSAH
jgi:hypothetical protein